jgi:PAS domain S-box-containing protein
MQSTNKPRKNIEGPRFLQGENKDFVTSLFNQSIDGIMVIDREGVVRLANPKAKALFKPLVDPLEGYEFGVPAISGSVGIQVHHTGEQRTIEMQINEIEWQEETAYLAILWDITDRVRAREELQESEQKYRQIFDNAINGFLLSEVVFDEEGSLIDVIVLDVNQAFEELFRLKNEDILGKLSADLISEFTEKDVLSIFRRVAMTNEAQRFEFHFESLDKDFLIVAYSLEDGKVATIFSDITDRVKTEERLRKSGERYRTLYETMTQGVMYLDPESRILSTNPAAERILGINMESLIGKKVSSSNFEVIKLDMTPFPDYRWPHKIALRTGRSVIDCVLGIKSHQHKECVWLNVSAIPQFHEGEEDPYQVISTFLDITDRIRVQKALQERVKELRCISRISSAIQRDPGFEKLCQITVQNIVNGMQYSDIAVAVVELAGQRFDSGGYSEDLTYCLQAPIRISGGPSGRVAVYYKEKKDFILPEEQNLLYSIAERLASYYERRHAHEQLRKSEERFRKSIMDAPIPVMIYADNGEIITVNNAWLQNSGYSREDIPTLSDWLKQAHRDHFSEVKSFLEESQKEVHVEEVEFSIYKKDGEERIWLFTTAPLEILPDGRITLISMARDITERKQAELDRERYYDRILALREVDKVVGSTLDLDSVLDRITSQLQRLITFDSMSVMLIDEKQMEIIACQGFEKPEEILGITFPSDPSYPNYEVYKQKKPVCYENISEAYPQFTQPVNEDVSTVINTWLGVPLIHQDEVIGMFTIDREEENLFSEEDIAIAMEFAHRAAIAITNARLYEQTRAQVDKLEILRKIDATITGNMKLDESLLEILGYIKSGLDVDAATIILYDDEKKVLTSEQGVGFESEIRSEIEKDLDNKFAGDVARERKPVFIREIEFTEAYDDKYPIDIQQEGITSYYGLPLIAKGKLEGVLQLFNRKPIEPDEDWIEFADALAGQAAVALNNISLFNNMEEANKSLIQAYDATIEGWAHALELRDQETEGHSRRVVDLTLKIAKRFGFNENDLQNIRRGVLLHDIGKMGIPDEILRKPGPLSEKEWDMMHQHPIFAYDMLKGIEYLEPALRIPHYHHERWDGSGYPEGLQGDEIPLEARIFAVVDIWDALLSDRYYRDAWSRGKTLRYIKNEAGKLLDPEVVAVFLEFVEGDKAEDMD